MTFEDALDIVYGEDPLIGKTVTFDGDEWTVDAYAWGGTNYVYLTLGKSRILRPAAVVRRSIELKEEACS